MSITIVVKEKGIRRQLGIKPRTELEINVEKGGILMRPKRKVSARDLLLGIAGKERVNLEEIEPSLSYG
jgi:bifunctional DNA-binding transcriptional regulator/antitoxin component of YhaV-PrlF toxin-antitoxin module